MWELPSVRHSIPVYDRELYKEIYENPLYLANILGYTETAHPYHELWIREVWCRGTSFLTAHRNSYKTTARIISVIWGLLYWPDTRIFITRKNSELAQKMVRRCMSHYESEELQDIFFKLFRIDCPFNPSQWAAGNGFSLLTKKKINNELNVEYGGIGKTVTGSHYDLIIADDVVTKEDRYHPNERERTKKYLSEMFNLLDTKTGIGMKISGTPWHPEDAYNSIQFDHTFAFPISLNFIPELTKEKRESLKKSIGEVLYSCNYDLKHISGEFTLFKEMKPPDFEYPRSHVVAWLDPSFTRDGDYCALTVAVIYKQKFIVIRGVAWRDILDKNYIKIEEECETYKVDVLYIESNGLQNELFVKKLKQRGKVGTCRSRANQDDKDFRIQNSIRPNLDGIYFELGHLNDDYRTQIMEYNESDKTLYRDAPDSLACLVKYTYAGSNTIERMLAANQAGAI